MSTGEVRRVSYEDIQLVQNLIEQCLRRYMNEKEVVNTLLVQAKIEPEFTEVVWQKLEEENRDFFKAYHLRLIVKDQITLFNRLIESQVNAMHHICRAGVSSTSISNGSHIPPSPKNSAGYTLNASGYGMESETMCQTMGSSLSHTLNASGYDGSSLRPCMQNVIDMSAPDIRIGVAPPSMMLSQSENVGMMELETGCVDSSPYMFCNGGNVLESGPVIGGDPVLSSAGFNSYPLSESLLDGYGLSFEFLQQIPQIFSLSDSTTFGLSDSTTFGLSDSAMDFTNSFDIFDYSRPPPFVAADTDNLLYSHGSGEYLGDNKRMRLDTISESMSYEDFGSD